MKVEPTMPKNQIELNCIGLNKAQIAKAIGMSPHWVDKDRRTKRLIPFYRIGGSIRYNLQRVEEALAKLEEGGVK